MGRGCFNNSQAAMLGQHPSKKVHPTFLVGFYPMQPSGDIEARRALQVSNKAILRMRIDGSMEGIASVEMDGKCRRVIPFDATSVTLILPDQFYNLRQEKIPVLLMIEQSIYFPCRNSHPFHQIVSQKLKQLPFEKLIFCL